MSETTQENATPKKSAGKPTPSIKTKLGRKTIKALGRIKRKKKLATDKAFAKTFFEAKSKRSTEKKSAFRKKKKGKK